MFSGYELRSLLPHAITMQLHKLTPSEIQAYVKYPPVHLECGVLYNVEVISVADEMKTLKIRLEESKLEDIQEEISKVERDLLEEPNKGDCCLVTVDSSGLPTICRGCIILKSFSDYFVYAVDFGLFVWCQADKLYNIPEALKCIPFQAIHVTLAGSEELEGVNGSIGAFQTLLERNSFKFQCRVAQVQQGYNYGKEVVLFDAEGQSVKDLILYELSNTDLVLNDQSSQTQNFDTELYGVQHLFVKKVYRVGNFFGQFEHIHTKDFENLQVGLADVYGSSNIQLYADGLNHKGSLAIVNLPLDERFYRVIIDTEYRSEIVQVRLLDYGRMMIVSKSIILAPLNTPHTYQRPFGILCKLYPNSVMPLDPDQWKIILLNQSVQVNVTGSHSGIFDVKLTEHSKNAKIKEAVYLIGIHHEVSFLVSHVESPWIIWVQPEEYKCTREELEDTLSTASENIATQDLRLFVGPLYSVMHPVKKRWYRAKLTVINVAQAMAHFVDYGDKHRVSLRDIRPMELKLRVITPLAVKCTLPSPSQEATTSGLHTWEHFVDSHLRNMHNSIFGASVSFTDDGWHVKSLRKEGIEILTKV